MHDVEHNTFIFKGDVLTMAVAKVKEQTILQFADKSSDVASIQAKVRQIWKDAGNKVSELKTIDIYLKPEEEKAYYVINGSVTGTVELFA